MENEDEFKALRIQLLAKKYLEKDLTVAERNELNDWLNKDARNQELLGELSNDVYLEKSLKNIGQFDSSRALERLQAKMAADANVPVIGRRRSSIHIYVKISVAAILTIGMWFFLNHRISNQPHLISLSVPYGKQQQLTLPDSSKVWLNAGTTIQYPNRFDGDRRLVNIKGGQAYFSVVHDKSKPFVVSADGVLVTVLGTEFEVKAFADEKEDRVTVGAGKVGVNINGSKKAAVMLLPDEQAVITKKSGEIKTGQVNTNDIATWRMNRLTFENEDFQNVIHALERKYNVHIRIENEKLMALKITLRLKNQPLTNVLNVLSFSNNFTYTKENEELIVIK